MLLNRHIRLALGFLIVAAILVIIAAILFVTESALSVKQQLQSVSPWVFYAYLGGIVSLAILGGWGVWNLLFPKGKETRKEMPAPVSEVEVDSRLEKALESGADVSEAMTELKMLRERRTAGEIFIAIFGDISAGKSSLIRALLPDLDVPVAATGGTTKTITCYQWESSAGDHLFLIDMPGTNEPERGLDALAREEAMRAHVVVYVCEGDLTRSQFQELQLLLALKKPLIVAVNKSDRYTDVDLKRILERLRERLAQWPAVEIVSIRAGGSRQVLRIGPDGKEEIVEQTIKPQVQPLQSAIQNCIDKDIEALEGLRDAAVFVLVNQKLEKAELKYRRQHADEIIQQYTRKAVVGALAAVSPGTDIIIQGYLGVNLIKELCELYQTPAREMDSTKFLQLVEAQTGKTFPLILALAGNTLKAFPGVGTVVGGLAHAVAYGFIFDALGNAVARTLESRGTLHTGAAVTIFKENLGGDLEARARRMVELAKTVQRDKQRND